MPLTNWISLISLLISLVSISVVIHDKYKASKLEKMNLIVDVLNYYFSSKDEKIYIEFSFINESSLPITISDSSLSSWKEKLPNTQFDEIGGSMIRSKELVEGDYYTAHTEKRRFNYAGAQKFTSVLPITIEPFKSTIICIGYYAGKSAPLVLPLRTGELNVKFKTTRDYIQGVANLQSKTFEYDTYDRKYDSEYPKI